MGAWGDGGVGADWQACMGSAGAQVDGGCSGAAQVVFEREVTGQSGAGKTLQLEGG